MSKALRVCATCKTRKKACDKCLPICGYCAKRNLACIYYEEEGYCYPRAVQIDPLTTTIAMTVDDLVHGQLRHVVSLTAVSIREMIDAYFRGVHTVFPVVYADDAIWSNLSAYEEDQQVLLADATLVVLAMYLLSMRSSSSQGTHEEQTTSIETVYITTKKLLGHVQALKTSSIYLVQATLLVAAFEYACCRPYAAYISIGACSRMAMVLARSTHSQQKDLRKVLGEHVFGGLNLLERLVDYTLFLPASRIYLPRCGGLYEFRLVACEVDVPFTPSLGYYQRSTKVEYENQQTITPGTISFHRGRDLSA